MCPIGTYGASVGLTASSQCQACSPGAYCAQTGLKSPDGLCDPGYFCLGSAKIPNPTDNVMGKICPTGGFCEYGTT